MRAFTLHDYQVGADYLLRRIPEKPQIALVLGSGLGRLATELENPIIVKYADIPNFLTTTVQSHAGTLLFGRLGGKYVVCMSGRFHYYEGYSFEELAVPVRVLKLLGVQQLLLTNAAGAVNTAYRVGDIMIISDHIKLCADSPLRGHNEATFGPRFFDVTTLYTPELRQIAHACAQRLGQSERMREGVYFFMGGPQFETPAEIRAIRMLGGDAVGMSTVSEALTAAHCGLRVLGLSLMTNMAAGVLPVSLSGEEIHVVAQEAVGRFGALLHEIVKEL